MKCTRISLVTMLVLISSCGGGRATEDTLSGEPPSRDQAEENVSDASSSKWDSLVWDQETWK